LTPKSTLYN